MIRKPLDPSPFSSPAPSEDPSEDGPTFSANRRPRRPPPLRAFREEGDLRASLRSVFGTRLRFLDFGMAGTPGLPDSFLPLDCLSPPLGPAVLGFLELKTGGVSGGVLRYKVRPSQREAVPLLLADRVPVLFLVGELGTTRAFLLFPSPSVLAGKATPADLASGVLLDFTAGAEAVREAVEARFLDLFGTVPKAKKDPK